MKKGYYEVYVENNKHEITKLRTFKTLEETKELISRAVPLYRQAGAKNYKVFVKYFPGGYTVEEIKF